MVLRIRLARLSRRHSPSYNIVLARDRTARDSRPIEVLGTYNPVPQTPLATHDTPEKVLNPATGELEPFVPRRYKDVKLDLTRTKYWLGVGAQPSAGVQGILGLLGLWEGRPGTKERLGFGEGREDKTSKQKSSRNQEQVERSSIDNVQTSKEQTPRPKSTEAPEVA